MENWGIQAVIMRPTEYDEQLHHHHGEFGTIDIKKEYDQALLFCFPHLFDHHHHHDDHATMEKEVVGDDLDQLFKPFYRVNFGTQSEFSPTTATATIDGLQTIHHHDSDQELQQDQEQNVKKFRGSSSNISQHAPKLNKRKNQQKRVVVQVTADGLSSDPWAWRKYGQKPIKGSIYPRSYYKCSSLKGCMARRQVEQSCTDSSIYILTYTADHNHPQPTRRNSLAGINRNRFKATPKCPTNSDGSKTVAMLKDSPSLSPTTPSVSSIDDEVLQESNIKQETMSYNKVNYQGQAMMAGVNDDDYMVFSDDFFDGLEDLGGYKMESSSYNTSNKQFPRVFS